jgi:hypothetical protein
MRLRDRLERIEELLNRPPRFGDGAGSGPCIIRIRGGLDGIEPLRATVGDVAIECAPGETDDDFKDRALSLAVESGTAFGVIGGLPDWPRDA